MTRKVENQLFTSKTASPLALIASPPGSRGRFREPRGAPAATQAFPLTEIDFPAKKPGGWFQAQGGSCSCIAGSGGEQESNIERRGNSPQRAQSFTQGSQRRPRGK